MCWKTNGLEYAQGYVSVWPFDPKAKDWRAPEAKKDAPYLWIDDDCPEDIRQRVLEDWPKVVKETKERHDRGEYSSWDWF